MTTLRTRLLRLFLAFAGLALLASAIGTAGVLYVQARASLDETLMAAALAEAHPWQEERYDNANVRSMVTVEPFDPLSPVVASSLYDQALRDGRPVWHQGGGARRLLLAVESDDAGETFVVVASAPEIRFWPTIGPFLAAYGATAAVVLLMATGLLGWVLSRALGPLERASVAIGQVRGLRAKARLELQGPPEVRELLSATNALLERLDAAYQSQISFTALAAHELRTPVTVLKGEVALAQRRDRSPEEYRAVLDRLQGEFERLHALVDGLLLLSRVDAGHVEQGKQVERLSHPVHLALEQERPALQAAGCTCSTVLQDDPEVSIHVPLLTTAISTLLRNAAQHAPGSTVRVASAVDGQQAVIRVCDDGPGMDNPEAMLARFGRSNSRGMGLGLPIAAEIARRHGGELSVACDSGTTVTLTLPLP